jgi:hypothetical protein
LVGAGVPRLVVSKILNQVGTGVMAVLEMEILPVPLVSRDR